MISDAEQRRLAEIELALCRDDPALRRRGLATVRGQANLAPSRRAT
jgi:hypothetical protein